MSNPRSLAFIGLCTLQAASVLFCAGCDDAKKNSPLDSCEFAKDDVCDEPVNCPFNTDETDCVAACATGVNLHLFAAACAYRNPPVEPPDDGDPSGGSLHLTGYRDATISIPDGEDLAQNVDRHYRIFVPRAYNPDRSTPLVIAMAGHRVSHYSMDGYTQLIRSADENGFIVIDAEQQWRWEGEIRWAWWSDWAWSSAADDNPDFDLIVDLIDQTASDYNIDLSRVYLVGHSRGASMAFTAAIELSDIIAGACVQSGFTEFGYLDYRLTSWDDRRVPMVFMHGIQDPDVTIDKGDALVDRLRELGWEDETDLLYYRLENVTHRWQPWLNQTWWDFLNERPLP